MLRPPALVPAAAALAWAGHGTGAGGGAGTGIALGWWLYLAGVIIVVGVAAWAMFAPEREDPRDEDG